MADTISRRLGTVPASARPATQINRSRLNGSVAHKLAVLIIGGDLVPGSVLPNEDAFSASFSVSRTAYREALRALVAKGLIAAKPRAGTRVMPREKWNLLDPDVLSWHLEVRPSRSFILSLFELRAIVEPQASALAAARRLDADLADMSAALRRLESEPEDSIAVLNADLDFHHGVLRATHSEALIATSAAVGSTLRWSVTLTFLARPRLHATALPFHQGIFDAIERQDAKAAERLMREHIQAATQNTLDSLAAAGLAAS
jgi:GntR family galactonate operon transcriptional repressor